ncbi:hypothetical protein BGX27_004078 [Mortierella sp. AM989]|nr:hypothetical protein BGX27_004078 [Mortierella sp. AM989]
MSVVPSIPASTMAPTNPRTDLDSSTSPPVTPPTKSGPDAGLARPSLPSPPPSSSSRHSRPSNHRKDLDLDQDQGSPMDEGPAIHNIARRLSPSAVASRPSDESNSQSNQSITPGAPAKTHSSSSSTSSSASSHHLPSTLTNKHVSVTKTKTLGHLTRSTSSEVDNEVANALASGRSIVSKTDWKEEDAQYLVQLIEAQFPKGNIIWDWVGQQMTNRGFTKSQCRSKWKRIRTKVLHGSDPPNKDRDARDHLPDQEQDELIDDEDDDMGDRRLMLAESRQEYGNWSQRQDYDRLDRSDPHSSHIYEPRNSYDQHRHEEYYYGRDRRESRRSQSSPAPPPPPSHRVSTSYNSGRHATENSAMEEDELWSDDDHGGRNIHDTTPKRYSQDYQTNISPSKQQHHVRQTSLHQVRDEGVDDSMRSISAITATPTSFGKIEWKPEDSDYLVHLIESKFALRKVDWAWVSKQMEGRGYDRTQCKSRWWRVQHRQNQNSQQNSSSSHHGSTSQPLLRNKQHRSSDQALNDAYSTGVANGRDDKNILSDEETHQNSGQRSSRQGSAVIQGASSATQPSKQMIQPDKPDVDRHRQQHVGIKGDEESQLAVAGEQGTSPRPTRAHEHQKHIEWKEEDSQYMYRLIEKEFPVGNVVWSVIGEKMQSRGYSQTQCMSKWRRHLKNNKAPNDASKSGMSMDLDVDIESGSNELRSTGNRRRGPEDHPLYNDSYTEGAKRFRRDGLDSRKYESSLDYKAVDPLDAHIVEMEYDRYYDAGGKRRRADDEDSQPPSESGYHHQDRSSPFEDYYGYDGDSGRRHPQEAASVSSRYRRKYSRDFEPSEATMTARDVDELGQSPVSAAYRDERHASTPTEHGRNHRRNDNVAHVNRGEDQEAQSQSRQDLQSSRKHQNQPPSTTGSQRKPEEKRERRGIDYSHTHSDYHPRHHHRSSSASSSYRDYHSSYSLSGIHASSDNVSHSHPYSREPAPEQNRGVSRHSSREPDLQSQTTKRSPDREPSTRLSIGEEREERHREADRDNLRTFDYSPEDIGNRDRHRKARLSHDYDGEYDRHHIRHSNRYSQRPRQDSDRRDSDFLDYTLEDEIEWAAGRWESRDMARLAAAVAKQGRRWDAIRAQIKIPVLVGPYDDLDSSIYDGAQFDPHPVRQYYPEEMRRSRYHHQRPPSYSTSRGSSDVYRRSSSSAARYGSPREPTSSLRPPIASEKRVKISGQSTLQTSLIIDQPVEVDLTMDNPVDEVVVESDPSTLKCQQLGRVEEDVIVDVVSIVDNEDKIVVSEPHKDQTIGEMKEVHDRSSEHVKLKSDAMEDST